MQQVPSGERIHIGIFGKMNVGKSSLFNALSSQAAAVVSAVPGTTTDIVRRPMELSPVGAVVLLDTPGLDDTGEIGRLRVAQTRQAIGQVHLALVVVDGIREPDRQEQQLLSQLKERQIPYILVYNLWDVGNDRPVADGIAVSAVTGYQITALKARIAEVTGTLPAAGLVKDFVSPGDLVILVTPIDEAAPKGRLILPQQMVLRELLDCHAQALVVQDTELAAALAMCNRKPALVITDSQVFARVMNIVPEDVLLTSFSILMARKKGELAMLVEGVQKLDALKAEDHILICEGCTHHRQCADIGTVKLPAWIRSYTGVDCQFSFTSGNDFPEDVSGYALIIHCGGCMLNDRQVHDRQQRARAQAVPMTNYGMAIAKLHGILSRSLQPVLPVAALHEKGSTPQ